MEAARHKTPDGVVAQNYVLLLRGYIPPAGRRLTEFRKDELPVKQGIISSTKTLHISVNENARRVL